MRRSTHFGGARVAARDLHVRRVMGYPCRVTGGVLAFVATIVVIGAATGGGVAHADGDHAVSASLGWATFSAPGKAMRNQAPPTLSPDVGGTVALSYEHAVSTDLGLRVELAGGVFYGGQQAMQSQTSHAALGDAGV